MDIYHVKQTSTKQNLTILNPKRYTFKGIPKKVLLDQTTSAGTAIEPFDYITWCTSPDTVHLEISLRDDRIA